MSSASPAVSLATSGRARVSVRLGLLAAIFIAELLAISIWLDGDMLRNRGGLAALVHDWGAWSIRAVVATALGFLVFGESLEEAERPRIDLRGHRVSGMLLGLHAASMAAFAGLSTILYQHHASGWVSNLIVVGWGAAGLAGIVSAACAMIPAGSWISQIRSLRDVLLFAIVAGVAACVIGAYARDFWGPLARWTLELVSAMLRPFVPVVFQAPLTIGTPRFMVEIAPECSGYEGIGLILALSSAWLWFMRRQWRFPRALLLIPAGVAAIWILNSVRIAALILIGNAGAERIALGGFHSQAGWIAFCLVSLGVCIGARKISWLAAGERAIAVESGDTPDPTAVYLTPFLAILAAGLATRAATGDFEWIYGLRVAAAGAALWLFRRGYRELDWRCGPSAFAMGAAVFALWVGLDRFLGIAPMAAPAVFQHA